MEKPPWVGERPVDPENCVHEPPNLWVKIAWPIKRKMVAVESNSPCIKAVRRQEITMRFSAY